MKLIQTVIALTLATSIGWAQNSTHSQSNIHKIVVEQVLQTTSYTYLLAEENGQTQWLALPKIEATIGETYYYQGGMEMRDFKSAELKRTFESVIFIQGVQSAKAIQGKSEISHDNQKTSPQASGLVSGRLDIKLDPADGGISIAELLGNRNNYANKIVKLRGKVMKFSSNIMGKNWIHLQDGTDHSDEYDITITSDMEAVQGDIVTIEGKITLDKDFGYGYFYKIIMEEGKIIDEIQLK